MSHLAERMEERVLPVDADRARELLRDAGALARLCTRAFPDSQASRFGVPLTGRDSPPLLIVDRAGRGITCLSAGMLFDGPQLAFADVEKHLRLHQERLRIGRAKQAMALDAADTLGRSVDYSYKITREEFGFLRTVAPLMLAEVGEAVGILTKRLARIADTPRRQKVFPDDKRAGDFWRLYCSTFISLLACAGEDQVTRPALNALASRDVLMSTRAIWILTQWPERTLAAIDTYRRQKTEGAIRASEQPLRCIAQRFAWLRKDAVELYCASAREVFGIDASEVRRTVLDRASRTDWVSEEWAWLARGIAELLPKAVAAGRPEAPKRPHAAEAELRAELLAEAGQQGRAAEKFMRLWDPATGFFTDPSAWRWPPPGAAVERAVRNTLWRIIPRMLPTTLIDCTPWCLLASAMPYDAIVPRSRKQEWDLAWGTHYVRERLHDVVREEAQPVAAAAASTVGRNEPCTCGSGKKFKKCCGVSV